MKNKNKVISYIQIVLVLIFFIFILNLLIEGQIESSADSDLEYFFVYTKLMRAFAISLLSLVSVIALQLFKD